MSAGATKDYAAITNKRQWRLWVWNQVSRLLPGVSPGDTNVVGLFGRDCIDYQAAARKGFDTRRFISVERSQEAARHARVAHGANVLIGNLPETLRDWRSEPGKGDIHVVVADLCGGMSTGTLALAESICGSTGLAPGCVVVVNLLRGRDPYGTGERADRVRRGVAVMCRRVPDKHRGLWFYESIWRRRVASLVAFAGGVGAAEMLTACVALEAPRTFHYRSGVQTFDSVAFRLSTTSPCRPRYWPEVDARTARRIAAARAIRTTRTAAGAPRRRTSDG